MNACCVENMFPCPTAGFRVMGIICRASFPAHDHLCDQVRRLCHIFFEQDASKEIDVLRPGEKRVESTDTQERSTFDPGGLQGNPLSGHRLDKTIPMQIVPKLNTGTIL